MCANWRKKADEIAQEKAREQKLAELRYQESVQRANADGQRAKKVFNSWNRRVKSELKAMARRLKTKDTGHIFVGVTKYYRWRLYRLVPINAMSYDPDFEEHTLGTITLKENVDNGEWFFEYAGTKYQLDRQGLNQLLVLMYENIIQSRDSAHHPLSPWRK
jgi:hypothetical protein